MGMYDRDWYRDHHKQQRRSEEGIRGWLPTAPPRREWRSAPTGWRPLLRHVAVWVAIMAAVFMVARLFLR